MAWKKVEDGKGEVVDEKFEISDFKISNLEILEILKKAKEYYLYKDGYDSRGMCLRIHNLLLINYKIAFYYSELELIIPEFNPDFLGGTINKQNYWWDIFDKESRIAAFDKLISTYDAKQWITYRY